MVMSDVIIDFQNKYAKIEKKKLLQTIDMIIQIDEKRKPNVNDRSKQGSFSLITDQLLTLKFEVISKYVLN